ncbi:helix-turn-helix protein [Phycisphaerae bacterium RAS1]|nr:helix-turn-helix protein [Phycisphaerae bacterium RAS1]
MAEPAALVRFQAVELDGVRYAIVPHTLLLQLCRRARLAAAAVEPPREPDPLETLLDPRRIAGRLLERRKQLGISQADLARRAQLRPETLNRLERGTSTPDFSTIRKLVETLREIEIEKHGALPPARGRPRSRLHGSPSALRRSP